MPSFANPFQGNVDRKLTNAELMQALRLDIAGELFLDGESEVREQLEELGITGESIPASAAGPTVGSLVEE